MPVARSYEKFEIQGDIFVENKRQYVNVMTNKGLKKVRWYTDVERARMDRTAGITVEKVPLNMTFNANMAFGFGSKGYIILYKGSDNVKEWATKSWPPKAWHNTLFGYYTPSRLDTGEAPEGCTRIKLTWDEVKCDDIHMKSYDEVQRYVDALLTNTTPPKGYRVNEWYEETVKVCQKATKDSRFGTKYTYTLANSKGNTFVWETGAKNYGINTSVSLKMKVKEIKNGTVVVWYCKEI